MNKKDRDALRTKADELQAAYRAMDSGVYGSSEFAAWKAAYQTAEEARKVSIAADLEACERRSAGSRQAYQTRMNNEVARGQRRRARAEGKS